jgi:hypothetical protein
MGTSDGDTGDSGRCIILFRHRRRAPYQDANGPVRFGPVVGPPNLEMESQVKVRPAPPFRG